MAQTYTRQSSLADGDTITAALFNNEYNQLVNAFAYSSSSASSTGHRHDGTAGQGGNIHTIGDLDFLNKIVVDDTNNRWGVFVEVSSAAVEQIRIQDGAIVPVTDSDIDLGTSSLYFKDAYIDSITTTGNVAVGGNLTVTGTTTFNGGTITMGDAATDNVVFGADVDSHIIPDDDDTYDLGSSSQQWRNLYIDGTANIDSLVADTADINGGTVDGAVIGGSTAAAITGTTITGTAITGTSFVIGSADISEAELETIDGVTAGTVAASKAIVVDSNKDFTGARNITLTGELDAGSLDVSGDVDVDGTLETDALSINGTAVTSTAAELNILDGVTSTAAELNILDGVTSTATELNLLDGVTSTTAELNILDGVTASAADINLIDGITNGTVIASKAIITDSNKDITGGRNITISGELDAATLDISGDADIDGTLEADAITIGGVTLAETISDTVGAMVGSNTETNITVTYEDSDNTLDFVIGTLNQDTTGNAATATALETARTIHGVSFDGTANIDLSEVVQDTVGAMFSSNTESGITVDYQDGDGTIDLTVGTLNQNTTGSAATLTTARTIGGVSFDGSANITPTTFTTATFSGDVNVDSGLLFADVSTNRIGINQASPDVTLDLGANTDAVHVPVGTTAQRPASPAAGYFRYNSTTGDFEGYTDAWGAIAGSGGTAPAVDTMTGDGSDTTLTLTSAPVNENATVVTLDGVVQHKSTYSVSGNTLTFSTAPPSGVAVECITWTNTAINAALLMQDADGDTQIQVEESSDEDKIRFDTGGTERVIIDSTGVDIAGGLDVDGTTNLDVVDIDGTVNMSGSLTMSGSALIRTTDGTASLPGIRIGVDNDTGFYRPLANTIGFVTTGAERMRLDASGNVGIGTTSPNAAEFSATPNGVLEVEGTKPVVYLSETDTTDAHAWLGVSSGVTYLGSTGLGLQIRTGTDSASTRVTVDTSGNVGIGMTPTAILDVKSDGNADAINLVHSGNTAQIISLGQTSDNSDGQIQIRRNNGVVHTSIRAHGNSYFNGGNVGIGQTSPEGKLHIENGSSGSSYSADGADQLILENNDSVGMDIRCPSGNTGMILFSDNGGRGRGQLAYYHSSDTMAFLTGATERLRINDVGNIGYGVTSVSSVLTGKTIQVGYGQISSDHVAYNYNTNFTNNAYQSGNDATWSAITSRASGVIKLLEDKFIFMNASSGTAGQAVSMNERMRIDSSGNMMVGKTAVGASTLGAEMRPDGFVGSAKASSANGSITFGAYSTTASQYQFYVGMAGTIYARATSISSLSDERRKENIVDLETGLPEVMALKPRRFDWKDGSETNVAGFIAQEVETVLPDLIGEWEDENNDDLKSVKMGDMLPTLVKAIQEQQEQIEQLKTEIQTLKGE